MSNKPVNEAKNITPQSSEVRENILKLLNENQSNDAELLLKLQEFLNKQGPKQEENGTKKEVKGPLKHTNLQIQSLDNESSFELPAQNQKQNKEKEKEKEKKKQPIIKEEDEMENDENRNIENNSFLRKKRFKDKNSKDENSQNKDYDNNLENLPSYIKLNELVKKYGFKNVLKCLCQSSLDQSKSLERNLQKMIDNEGGQKLSFMLLSIHCNICDNKDNSNNDGIEKKKGSKLASPMKKKINNDNNDNDMDNEDDDEDNNEDDDRNINDEVKIDLDSEKNVENSIQKGNSSRFRKELGLGVHFHKDDKDNIYKYCLHHFLGETRAIFYCSDKQCKSIAKYDVVTKVFTITIDHSKSHSQHNYILNFDSEKKDKVIFLDFKKKSYKEGQVFRKGEGKRIVQWYNC